MKTRYWLCAALACLLRTSHADARGFGGYAAGGARVGGFSAGGFNAGGFRAGGVEAGGAGGFRFGEAGGVHTESFSGLGGRYDATGERSAAGVEGWRGGAAAGSMYDRNLSGPRGGDVNVEGARGAATGPYGGGVAGATRDVTATGPNGRSYTDDRSAGAAVGPYGRAVGGAAGTRTFAGATGAGAEGWRSAFSNYRMPTDLGHWGGFNNAVGRTTAFWSSGTMSVRAGAVRTAFPYYGAFRPGWYAAHPGVWVPGGWAANAAWVPIAWPALSTWCAIPAEPVYYDFGNSIIYQDNVVYQDGTELGTSAEYAKQATTLADAGQAANPPAAQQWKALGVYALVQGDEQTSNNVFQLAIDQNGIIRGNYYDGLLDTTTPVYGSLDKKTQRVAWSIGKKNDRVFDTGLANLTKDQAPVLVHLGSDRTVQMLLVRMEDPKK